MKCSKTLFLCLLWSLTITANAQTGQPLAGTKPLRLRGDLSQRMREGIDKYLTRETAATVRSRQKFWAPDFSSREAYGKSIAANRRRFAYDIGASDELHTVAALELIETLDQPALIARTDQYAVFAVRWPAFGNVFGEGLLLEPLAQPIGVVVAIPDADQTPEMLIGSAPGIAPRSQFARRLAEQGFRVVVPVLIDRNDEWAGNPAVIMTNQTHREWIYRSAYPMGRHIIGYEVNKILALVDWLSRQGKPGDTIGVAGYGEGGLLALYTTALDPRIDATLVSGYFDSRQDVWQEPIYRNVFGLLQEFGDAEIAGMIAPRALIVEHSIAPEVDGPPKLRPGRLESAAPGRLTTPTFASIDAEVARVRTRFPAQAEIRPNITLIAGKTGAPIPFGFDDALSAFVKALEIDQPLQPSGDLPVDTRSDFDPGSRQQRQVQQLIDHTMHLLANSHHVREKFWEPVKPSSIEEWQQGTARYREAMLEELIGRLPPATLPPKARTRQIYDQPKWTGYEVVLDVYPDVICWGYLLVPKDIQEGEKSPVVVCQHGLEGTPESVVTDDPDNRDSQIYCSYAAKLADEGFVTYAPHNFYKGGNEFRQLQRKANPLKNTLFGITTVQHQQMLDWLSSLPFVDPQRIGFYGLSYGGNTATRVPAILEQYACVIDSGDFNEWVTKTVSVHYNYCFPPLGAYEVGEFNLGHTFNHSDMVGLIAPRPFMVERGHKDGVAPDEWVAAEYARVRRLYVELGIPERTEIEFFNGPHKINGVGTFEFLRKHLNWPRQ
ncbi:Dienelactone hydrolase family protein [Symmachiella macrocystis]|uniref:Dienelactone hydrolase family protein n=1 Tax=Symmachiella macrocystis TaxID=2527985 RepID=A0A5C6BHU1_9PLAN|nr:dienelactone hydrolase family protein [Symmachiella macrocystis]TWU11615.1 Dienelactone hydrolase family protein [Symmachiella macrocystis]